MAWHGVGLTRVTVISRDCRGFATSVHQNSVFGIVIAGSSTVLDSFDIVVGHVSAEPPKSV